MSLFLIFTIKNIYLESKKTTTQCCCNAERETGPGWPGFLEAVGGLLECVRRPERLTFLWDF